MKGEGKMEENAKKAPQSAQKEKFNFKNWIEAHVAEFKRIVWPSKEELAKETATVIVVSLIVGIIILLIELGFEQASSALVNLFA